MQTLLIIVMIIAAYFIGSLSSAIIVCRLMGLPDPRTQGSNNPGATNVLRIGGKKAAAVTLLGDALKGFIPVLIAKYLGLDSLPLALVMLAAFLGHLYPVFFSFVGGKGVATLIGCLFALSLPVGFFWVMTWLIVALVFRYSSLAALTASVLAPFYVWFFVDDTSLTIITIIMTVLLIYRHRSNIVKLYEGKESKIGKKS